MSTESDYFVSDFFPQSSSGGNCQNHYDHSKGNGPNGNAHNGTGDFAGGGFSLQNSVCYKKLEFQLMNLSTMAAKYRHLLGAILLIPMFTFGQLKKPVDLLTGADQSGAYLPLLHGKNVGVLANQTSMKGDLHIVDFLIQSKVSLKRVFSPEHGFRGKASAGEKVNSALDEKTGLPIVSLYGKNKKPTAEQLKGLDVVIFDIQDVGARFYTYISTMTYVMEACAENHVTLLILDRPNPNGYYVDGPVLKKGFESFVGLHPVPIVHGMTVAEYAQMVNGEAWLKNGIKCKLQIVKCKNYDHKTTYDLPVKPSPNLPNGYAIDLYPSLCLFEGTNVSVGRGTDFPFQQIGAPYFPKGTTTFTPKSNEGAKNPKYQGQLCNGFILQDFAQYYVHGLGEIYLFWLVEAYKQAPNKDKFFTSFFNTLAGTDELKKQIKAGMSAMEIRESWRDDVNKFKNIRQKYLLYPDFQ